MKTSCPRFSEQFGIGKSQCELEFVDILLQTDLPLYIDPYSFKICQNTTAIDCNNLVVDFFSTVVDCIRQKKDRKGQGLLNMLNEPNETRFGVSSKQSNGRGVGRMQSNAIYERLKESLAVQTGMLKDLSDCELLIPGISEDKISDITTNIIMKRLADFTDQQCRNYKITTRQVAAGPAWDEQINGWTSRYFNLPSYQGKPIVLVPKWMVRRAIAANHQEYYRDFVLEFLQREHLTAGSSLVEVLKSGKRRVTKKSLMEQHPCSKDFLRQFSEEHPDVLKQYREFMSGKSSSFNNGDIESLIREYQKKHGGPTIVVNNHFGDVTMGDMNTVNGNAVGGVVGSGSVNARDITAFNTSVMNAMMSEELKKILIEARKTVDDSGLAIADKSDLNDGLGRITDELSKTEREPGLIRRYYNRIKEVSATVAEILKSASEIKTIIESVAS
ncbi:MAG: hypothetical protein ACRC8S_06725 [Fimbriiglobus sp.]